MNPLGGVDSVVDSESDGTAGEAQASDAQTRRLTAGRPANFPNALLWLEPGILRNFRGVLTALVAAWLYIPAALAVSISLAFTSAIVAPLYMTFTGDMSLYHQVFDVPLIGDSMQSMAGNSSGVMTAFLGAIFGAVIGFIIGIYGVFFGPFQNGVLNGVIALLATIVLGIGSGLLYTGYRVAFEKQILQVTGARRLSRREAELILPLITEVAARLGLSNYPPVLINDSEDANAFAYTRHIVINRGFLEEFSYEPEPISAVLAHELVHWRNGDPISSAFVRGVALPLYLVQAAAGWLRNQTQSSVLRFIIWIFFWPVFITVQCLVAPMQAADSRQAEYRADQGAVLAGYRAGMRRIVRRISFEGGQNGWVDAICATHPPRELRLERLEKSGNEYRLPDEDASVASLPILFSGKSNTG